MRVVGLDNKVYNIQVTKLTRKKGKTSSYHKLCRELLKKIFPMVPILEEVSLPGSRLVADFLIPNYKLMIEVHGEQHYTANSFFYDNPLDFKRAQLRDVKKKEWCELNEIDFIELSYKETLDEWEQRIKRQFKEG